MLSSLITSGKADKPATFELFARKLPAGRRFGVVAGLGRFLELYKEWSITEEDIAFLKDSRLITPAAEEWLKERVVGPLFTGDLYAYPEGEKYYPYSPVVRVEGKLGEAILLETLLLSIINHDTAVASAAARMVLAANGRTVIEMGSRRTDDEAAVSSARAAYLAGFASTSNVEAARRWGIPVAGTAAHAYTLAHESEEEAFKAQMETWGVDTTLLVDTYSTPEGIKNAVKASQSLGASGPRAIRIDSGDLLVETHEARQLLDSLGATDTKIVVSSDLDEYLMEELTAAPIDGYGAGTRVVTGSGHPTAGMVYKLVEIDGRPVAKKSASKASVGGKKLPYRRDGQEYYSLTGTLRGEPVQMKYLSAGRLVVNPPLEAVRERAAYTLATLTPEERRMSESPTPVAHTELDPLEE